MIDGQEVPRRAGLSSFGAGGSNAHMILEEYIPRTEAQTPEAHPPALIVLSAKTGTAPRKSGTAAHSHSRKKVQRNRFDQDRLYLANGP